MRSLYPEEITSQNLTWILSQNCKFFYLYFITKKKILGLKISSKQSSILQKNLRRRNSPEISIKFSMISSGSHWTIPSLFEISSGKGFIWLKGEISILKIEPFETGTCWNNGVCWFYWRLWEFYFQAQKCLYSIYDSKHVINLSSWIMLR